MSGNPYVEPKGGGPAFPVVAENGLGHVSDGMSLRQWYAGMALIARGREPGGPVWRAKEAFAIADELIAAEETKP